MIDDEELVVKGLNVLELGSGTGITGLVSGRMGSKLTLMTDYHPVVIKNASNNIELNDLNEKVQCMELNWEWVINQDFSKQDPLITNTIWDKIIAADCIFDLFHAKVIPLVSKHYLSKQGRFHVLLPHRLQFKKEISTFEENMERNGWILEYSHWIHKHSLTFRYYIYKL